MTMIILAISGILLITGAAIAGYYLYRIRQRNTPRVLYELLLATYQDTQLPLSQRAQAGLDLAEMLLNQAHAQAVSNAQHIIQTLCTADELDQALRTHMKYVLAGILLEQCDKQSYACAGELLQDTSQPTTQEQKLLFNVVKSAYQATQAPTYQQCKKILETLEQALNNSALQPYARAWAINTRTQLLALCQD